MSKSLFAVKEESVMKVVDCMHRGFSSLDHPEQDCKKAKVAVDSSCVAYLSLFFQYGLQLIELHLHGVYHSIGLLQLIQPVAEAIICLPVLCLFLTQQADVEADQVHVALRTDVVPEKEAQHQ